MGKRFFRSRRAKAAEEPSVNLTPLIDVVFSILIMFIVVAPLLEMEEIELADAKADPHESIAVNDAGPVAIHVHQDNSVWLNQRKVEMPTLSALLKKEREQHPSCRPQLFHDRRASFGTYQSVKNAAEAAGFRELDLILKPA